jgi:hypothetical protein
MRTSTHLATLTATIDKRKSSREVSKKTKIIQQRKQLLDYNDDEASPSLAPFKLFFERNALANIVDIVTGAAFARQGERPPSRQLQSQLQQLWKLEEPVVAGVLPTPGQISNVISCQCKARKWIARKRLEEIREQRHLQWANEFVRKETAATKILAAYLGYIA